MNASKLDQDNFDKGISDGSEFATANSPVPPNWGTKRRFWVLPLILLAAVVPLAMGWKMLMNSSAASNDTLVPFTVTRGTLPISVTERGNLESQNTEEVICDVENLGGDRSGVTGTQILFIVPNGSSVKKGDLLVELDSAPLTERLDSQFLSLQRAEAEKLQATSRYDNRITQNETELKDAELDVELAEIDLKSYEDETGGTFEIELQNIEMEIQTARAQQMIRRSDRDAINELHKLGYKSKGDLATAKLEWMKSNTTLASQMAKRRQLRVYTYEKETKNRKGRLETAKRNLLQVERNNESELSQAEAARDSAERAYDKEKERYERYQEQLDNCKIYAPQDGMVAYASNADRRGGGSVIEEGAFVRQRQQILTIPDLTSMQVSTAVHESVLDQVRPGLPAAIRVDAFPDRSYQGSVKTVAVLPDQGGWMSSDTKVYKTIVTIDEAVEQLKPGMTAVVEIDVEQLRNVLTVPVQAIVQRGNTSWCYLKKGNKPERCDVSLGATNDKYVEIKSGLTEGDIVVLNPMSLLEEEQESEEGEGEGDATGDEEQSAEAEDGGVLTPEKADASPQKKRAPFSAGAKRPDAAGAEAPTGQRPPGGGARGGMNFDSLDANSDGTITKDELPTNMAPMLDRLDANGDGALQRSEMPSRPRKK